LEQRARVPSVADKGHCYMEGYFPLIVTMQGFDWGVIRYFLLRFMRALA